VAGGSNETEPFSAVPTFVRYGPKADKRGRKWIVRFVPIADIREMTCAKKKDRLATVSPKSDQVF
jgi:hypothetical protein